MADTRNPFWIVWNPERGLPRCRHSTFEDAMAEAKRLARTRCGEEFIVLLSRAAVCVRDPVEVVAYDNDDGIPF